MPTLARLQTFVLRAPVATPVVAAFGALTERVSVLVRVEDSEGAHGWGDIWSNVPSLAAPYRAELLDRTIGPMALGQPVDDPVALWSGLDRRLATLRLQSGDEGGFSAALAALDLAVHDMAGRRAGLPLWRALGGRDGSPVPAYASGINPGPGAADTMAAARAGGFRAFKIKIGFGAEADFATLQAPVADLRPGERLMVDANQGWDLREATSMVARLRHFPLDWIEEPLRADSPVHEWGQVAGSAGTVLAAGENLRGAGGFQAAIDGGALGVIQPDLAKWGGHSGCRPVALAALAAGLTYCPHWLGGAVGQLHALHLLAAVRGPGMLEVDVNPNPLRENLAAGLFTPVDGKIALPVGPGIGIEPDLAAVAAFTTQRTDRRA